MSKETTAIDETAFEYELQKINQQKPSKPTDVQVKEFTTKSQNAKKKVRKNMKKLFNSKIDWKETRRKAKTIAIVMMFTAAVAFIAGMKYQSGLDAHTSQKVSEAVKELSLKQSKNQQ